MEGGWRGWVGSQRGVAGVGGKPKGGGGGGWEAEGGLRLPLRDRQQ